MWKINCLFRCIVSLLFVWLCWILDLPTKKNAIFTNAKLVLLLYEFLIFLLLFFLLLITKLGNVFVKYKDRFPLSTVVSFSTQQRQIKKFIFMSSYSNFSKGYKLKLDFFPYLTLPYHSIIISHCPIHSSRLSIFFLFFSENFHNSKLSYSA